MSICSRKQPTVHRGLMSLKGHRGKGKEVVLGTSGLAMYFRAWISFDLLRLSMGMGFGPTPARRQASPQKGCTAGTPIMTSRGIWGHRVA